jgi:ATP-dependent RNA helicase RhlE
MDRVLVFTRTKHGADRVVRKLGQANIRANAIHGNKSQPQRERALGEFKQGKIRVLVATDIAARGIDIPGVSHVFNFELPNVAEQYVHRIGRTARAGADGVAVAFCAQDERDYLRDIQRLTKITLNQVPLPENLRSEVEETKVRERNAPPPARAERDDRKPRRPSPNGNKRPQIRSHRPGGEGGGQRREGNAGDGMGQQRRGNRRRRRSA